MPVFPVTSAPVGLVLGVSQPAGSSFTPLSLTPIAWWDFSTLAGVDGSAISTIADLSGNSHTATQPTGGNQPLVKAGVNGINSLKVGLFDGVDDGLLTTAFTTSQPFVVYAVVAGGGAAGNPRYLGTGDTSASVRAGWDAGGADNFAGASLIGVGGTPANPKVVTSVFNGVSSSIRLDGAAHVAGDVGAGSLTGGMTIGNSASTLAQPWNGKVGELFVVAGSSVSTAAEAYLKAKWGTP